MLIHPQFDPALVSFGPFLVAGYNLGPFAIRWYGLMYVVAFIAFLILAKLRVKRGFGGKMSVNDVDDLLLYGVLGVILGGRLGYVLFYKADYYLGHPLEIFQVWSGGLSFHGGFLGVLVAVAIFCRRRKFRWIEVMDVVAPAVPVGLGAGRMGNFINGELPGRPTDVPWGMWFPQIDPEPLARHPSQLYQFACEGVILFVLLWWFASRPRPAGAVSAFFLIGYGALRFISEFGRQPDDFLGLLAFNLSMGQWLSIPMVAAGVGMMIWAYKER